MDTVEIHCLYTFSLCSSHRHGLVINYWSWKKSGPDNGLTSAKLQRLQQSGYRKRFLLVNSSANSYTRYWQSDVHRQLSFPPTLLAARTYGACIGYFFWHSLHAQARNEINNPAPPVTVARQRTWLHVHLLARIDRPCQLARSRDKYIVCFISVFLLAAYCNILTGWWTGCWSSDRNTLLCSFCWRDSNCT